MTFNILIKILLNLSAPVFTLIAIDFLVSMKFCYLALLSQETYVN